MKDLKYILFVLICTLFVSCMGEDYADPQGNGMPPYGNNELQETNVVSIAALKTKYASTISSNGMEQISEDIQIKGYVTGNDIEGNIYNSIALQDETGAIIISIGQGGLHGSLPVGQQILVSLKGLVIGGYGMQPQIGAVYTNKNGTQSVGRMNRYAWSTHHKILGTPDASKVKPTDFDLSKIGDQTYLAENCGKLMTLKKVKLKDADGKAVFAPNDGSVQLTANNVNRAIQGHNNIVVRTSTYADFANMVMPTEVLNITGIFTRFRDTWQILIRSTGDIEEAPKAIYQQSFAESQGDFTIFNTTLPTELANVWSWASANFGMKATAYVTASHANVAAESWLISPSIDLTKAAAASLSVDQALNFLQGNTLSDFAQVAISTDYQSGDPASATWTPLTLSQYPAGSDWNFVTGTTSLNTYKGKKIRIAFHYKSTSACAPTWEVKNFTVE